MIAVLSRVANAVAQCMQQAVARALPMLVSKVGSPQLYNGHLSVPLVVRATVGNTWARMTPVDLG